MNVGKGKNNWRSGPSIKDLRVNPSTSFTLSAAEVLRVNCKGIWLGSPAITKVLAGKQVVNAAVAKR